MDANQNRSEFKFLLKPGLESILRTAVGRNLSVDAHSNDGYPVLTEYFDSAERSTYWQKQMGVPNRRRVRCRLYGRPDGSIPPSAFIEVKHKLDGSSVKRRVSCGVEDLAVFSGGRIPEHLASSGRAEDQIIGELENLVVANGGRPVVQIRYHRYAYDSGPEGTIRITFDLDPRCRFLMKPLVPDCPDFDLPLLDPGVAIMEVKTIGPVPFWFRSLVGRFNLIPRGFSKYASALEKYEFAPKQGTCYQTTQ
jgi:hypothetical protein